MSNLFGKKNYIQISHSSNTNNDSNKYAIGDEVLLPNNSRCVIVSKEMGDTEFPYFVTKDKYNHIHNVSKGVLKRTGKFYKNIDDILEIAQ